VALCDVWKVPLGFFGHWRTAHYALTETDDERKVAKYLMTKKRWSKIEEKIHAPSKLKYAADNSLTFQSKDTSVVKFSR